MYIKLDNYIISLEGIHGIQKYPVGEEPEPITIEITYFDKKFIELIFADRITASNAFDKLAQHLGAS